MKRLVVALLCGGIALCAQARHVEPVTFASLDRGADGSRVQLHAVLLLRPGVAPEGGRPAIVALHGCGGMYSTRAGREGELAERLALRVDPLLRDGYAVLFVDSFRSRGVEQVCTIKHGERTVRIAQRRLDSLNARDRYRPGAPTRVYIGALDDWTPAATCVELGKAMAVRNEDLLVTTYADSYHAFDSQTGTLVHRTDVPNGAHPGEGVHAGPNPVAREAANASVHAFLRERLRE